MLRHYVLRQKMEEIKTFDEHDDMLPCTPQELRNICEIVVIKEIETNEVTGTSHELHAIV